MIPPLLDLCLFAVCKNLNASEFLNTLPDFLRQRLGLLFRQEKQFQDSITHLNFSHCYRLSEDEVKSISYLKNLTNLNLSHCEKLSPISMSFIGQLKNLKTLCLNHCPQVSVGFYFLQTLQLTKLEIAFCEVQDPVVPFITSMTSLTYLNLMCNRLTDEGCAKLPSLINLSHLSLSMNPLITDDTLTAITVLKNLTSLNLNFCKLLTASGIGKLSKALSPNLKQLDMIGCDRALTDAKARPVILLAEDSKIQARMISMVLNRYNFDVEVATNGEMALEMFRANPRYNLILMDVVMPVMDGPTCVKQIREYENSQGLKRTPIIIQTADNRESQRTTCLEAGCDDFLPKPLDKACISLAKELMEVNQRNPKYFMNKNEKLQILEAQNK